MIYPLKGIFWGRAQIELTSAQNEKIKTLKIFLFLVQIGYVPKLQLNLQLSVHWLLSDINLA